MPIPGIDQPELLPVSDTLRLRRYDGNAEFARDWYQDERTLRMVDDKNEPYKLARLNQMYRYLDGHGELYFIELLQGDSFLPIGDVTLCRDDLPIVIGVHSLRGQGIGRQVLNALTQRAKALGFEQLGVHEIYANNLPSQRLFESVGFRRDKLTADGYSYILTI